MAYYTERSIKHWSVRCTNNRCASNQSTDPEGSRSQSSHIAFWRHFTAKQDMGKCWISFDSTLTRACKPMTRSNLIVLVTLTWLDHVMTRKNFIRLWLEGLVTLNRQRWLGHITGTYPHFSNKFPQGPHSSICISNLWKKQLQNSISSFWIKFYIHWFMLSRDCYFIK